MIINLSSDYQWTQWDFSRIPTRLVDDGKVVVDGFVIPSPILDERGVKDVLFEIRNIGSKDAISSCSVGLSCGRRAVHAGAPDGVRLISIDKGLSLKQGESAILGRPSEYDISMDPAKTISLCSLAGHGIIIDAVTHRRVLDGDLVALQGPVNVLQFSYKAGGVVRQSRLLQPNLSLTWFGALWRTWGRSRAPSLAA